MTRKSTITRERLEEIRDCSWMDDLGLSMDELSELARMALAAIDSEPVGKPFMYGIADPDGNAYIDELCVSEDLGLVEDTVNELNYDREEGDELNYSVVALYRHAQLSPERDQVRREHADWSQATFGNVGPVGPLKHLSKEALEAAAEPGDLSEWADMQFLLWDAQRRAGISDEQITQAMIEKLAVNKQREWPEPKDGEPRLHIKEQPAPVVQCPFPCGWDNLNKLAIQNAAFVACALVAGEPATESLRQAAISNNDCLLKVISSCRAAMLQAQSDDDGEPTDDERIMAIEGIYNCERCGDEGWVVGEMGITRCVCGQAGDAVSGNSFSDLDLEGMSHGNNPQANAYRELLAYRRNSPAQSYCSPAQNSVAPEQSPIDHGYRPDCECTGCKATARICAELAGWIPVSERMPEDEQEVITRNRMGHCFVSFFDQHSGLFFDRLDAPAACCIEHVLVTHWKPLPATPQEVQGE